jgi:hypothetical protein
MCNINGYENLQYQWLLKICNINGYWKMRSNIIVEKYAKTSSFDRCATTSLIENCAITLAVEISATTTQSKNVQLHWHLKNVQCCSWKCAITFSFERWATTSQWKIVQKQHHLKGAWHHHWLKVAHIIGYWKMHNNITVEKCATKLQFEVFCNLNWGQQCLKVE